MTTDTNISFINASMGASNLPIVKPASEFTGSDGKPFINAVTKIDIEKAANTFKRVHISGDFMSVTTTKFIRPETGHVHGTIVVNVRVYDKNSGKSVSKKAGQGETNYGADGLVKNVFISQWANTEGKNISIKNAHMAKKDHSWGYSLATRSNGKNGVNELLLEDAKAFISDMVALNPKTIKAKAENKPLTEDELAAMELAQLAEIEAMTN